MKPGIAAPSRELPLLRDGNTVFRDFEVSVTMAPRGRYWSETPETGAKYVWVDYGPGGGGAMDLTEQNYRDKGYSPPIERLPSKEQYDRSYELEYAPKGSQNVSFVLFATANEALESALALERSDEQVRRIKAPGGHEIGIGELKLEAGKKGGGSR